MKILSSFTHSQAVPNYYSFLFFCWTQKIFGNTTVDGPHWLPPYFPHSMEGNWEPSSICSPTFFKISSFIFHHLALAAKVKVLMLAYKTTTGTAPIYLNSLVQTCAPLRCLRSLQVNDALWYIPKRHKITLTDLFLDCSQQVERPAYINPSSWIFSHFQ